MSDHSQPGLPHGVILWEAMAGHMAAGDPLAELAYRTLDRPHGIRASHLQALDTAEQAETICCWVQANYQPVPLKGRSAGWGIDEVYIPATALPAHALLQGVFASLLTAEVIENAAVELQAQSELWEPTAPNSWNDSRPLSRGVILRPRSDSNRYGTSNTERAYVNAAYPTALRDDELHTLSREKQAQVAAFWFLSNYEPFPDDGQWCGPGPDYPGFDQGVCPPDRWSPDTLLRKEFTGVVRFGVRNSLAAEFSAQSPKWMLISDQPTVEATTTDPQAELDDRLDRLERIVARIEEARGGIGHNQGPPLLSDLELASAKESSQAARSALAAGENGQLILKSAQGKFTSLASSISNEMLKGAAKNAGGAVWSVLTSALYFWGVQLYHALQDAASAIGSLLSTTLFPPLL